MNYLLIILILSWLIEEYLIYRLKNEVDRFGKDSYSVALEKLKAKLSEGVRGKFIKINVKDNKISQLITFYNITLIIFFTLVLGYAVVKSFNIFAL